MTAGPDDEPTVSVHVDELAKAFDVLLRAARDRWGDEVQFPIDLYWHLGASEAFDPYANPELTMGSLADDVDELRGLVGRGEVLLGHDLDHLIGVLRALVAMDSPDDLDP